MLISSAYGSSSLLAMGYVRAERANRHTHPHRSEKTSAGTVRPDASSSTFRSLKSSPFVADENLSSVL
jgi:hypothetical protein